jgi:hypothetical protein
MTIMIVFGKLKQSRNLASQIFWPKKILVLDPTTAWHFITPKIQVFFKNPLNMLIDFLPCDVKFIIMKNSNSKKRGGYPRISTPPHSAVRGMEEFDYVKTGDRSAQ